MLSFRHFVILFAQKSLTSSDRWQPSGSLSYRCLKMVFFFLWMAFRMKGVMALLALLIWMIWSLSRRMVWLSWS